jgi:uncharacterized Zn finger protein
MDTHRLTERKIRDYVGGRSFGLGEEYFESGAIHNARREGTKLTASCHGSYRNAYKVRATLDADGGEVKSASCTCPVGSGACKHVAALLLAWVRSPDLFAQAQETDALLESKTREELIALVKQLLRRRPELESLIDSLPAPGKPAEPGAFRRQADAVFAGATGDWDEAYELADELLEILETADGFMQVLQWGNAAGVYEGVLASLVENLRSYQDDEGALTEVLLDCVDGIERCLPKLDDPARRLNALWSLMTVVTLDNEMGGYGFSDGAYELIEKHGSIEERRQLLDQLRRTGAADNDWIASYEETLLTDDEYIALCRSTGRHDAAIQRLLERRRVDEAASAALHMDEPILPRIADLFVSYGHAEAAEEFMRQRAHRSTRPELLRWLRDRCAARGDHQAALEYARREYQAKPTIEGYEEVRRLAKRLKQWDSLRADALRLLASRSDQKAPAVQALVKEGLVDEAVSLMRSERLDHLCEWLARSVEQARPDVSIELYATAADRLIARRNRQNYHQACLVLSRVRKLCASLDERDAWKTRAAAIRKRYAGLPALMEEMRKSKLIH